MTEPLAPVLGTSRAAREIREFAQLAAGVSAPVLITGETGTGKGVLAAAIHDASVRAKAQLVAVNCAGVPESLFESEFFGHARGAFTGASQARRGLFELADRGTLFLDEVGELTLPLQAKLLTAMDHGEIRRLGAESPRHVDVRILAATAVDLEAAVGARTFRLDLYHRLLVLSFHMPPLRERGADIVLLARHFVCTFAARYDRHVGDLDPAFIRVLEQHPWPGNIRQLAHAMEAAVLHSRGPRLRPPDIPARILHPAAGPDTLPPRYSFYGTESEERARIEAALRAHHGNLTRTARSLGMARNTLKARISALRGSKAAEGRLPARAPAPSIVGSGHGAGPTSSSEPL
ncbi:MAG TPA: sigma-54 dependent transcriptional regulator [Longimicrobiales bacterium]|nr:sigma-54 dependent transcriptional regulator [Longimicrobiales bacterium]